MSVHDWSEHSKKLIDFTAYCLAGVAAVSLSQTALIMSIFAGGASFLLACLRIYDWFRNRPAKND